MMGWRHAFVAGTVGLVLWAGCSDDGTSSSSGEGGTVSGTATGTASGAGGAGELVCIEIGKFTPAMEDFPPCDVGSQADCLCEGCVDDGVCFNAAAELVDDCVCPDCANDPFCLMPDNCTTDGQCNPYVENCACADCAAHPECQ
ncbi:MAG TPA: hypothetical protein ENK57_08545 [Polyangiaceae bacterium]|nr:hypothetical protein [Polyangiaceae bacterium]